MRVSRRAFLAASASVAALAALRGAAAAPAFAVVRFSREVAACAGDVVHVAFDDGTPLREFAVDRSCIVVGVRVYPGGSLALDCV